MVDLVVVVAVVVGRDIPVTSADSRPHWDQYIPAAAVVEVAGRNILRMAEQVVVVRDMHTLLQRYFHKLQVVAVVASLQVEVAMYLLPFHRLRAVEALLWVE